MTLNEVWLLTSVCRTRLRLSGVVCYPSRDTTSIENRPQNGENTSLREIVRKKLAETRDVNKRGIFSTNLPHLWPL